MNTKFGRKISRDEREFVEMHAGILCGFADSFIRDGSLDPTGKSPIELYKSLRRILRKYDLQETDISFTIDHTNDLLSDADGFQTAGRHLLVSVFLATWIEHSLNRIVRTLGQKKRLREADTDALIRDTSLRAKFILCHMLCGERPTSAHLNRLQKVSEFRNYFLHYKWRPREEKLDTEVRKANRAARFLVKYLNRFEADRVTGAKVEDLEGLKKLIEQMSIESGFYGRFHSKHAELQLPQP